MRNFSNGEVRRHLQMSTSHFSYRPGQPNWDFLTVGIPRCGNWGITLPLWFYVKSILADLRRSKTAVLTILEALNFDFWKKISHFKSQNFPTFQNSELLKWSKLQILGLQNNQNWFHVKSKWQKNPANFQLGCPGL